MAVNESSISTAATIFDIHFLQDSICAELSPRDLRRCCLVSRDFYQNFTPYLYRSINISRRSVFKKFCTPESLAALGRHCDLVTEFTCVFAKVWKLLLDQRCFNLEVLNSPSLQYRLQNREVNKLQLCHIIALTRSCPRLRVIELSHFWYSDENVDQFCSAIRDHDQLREVKIDHFDYVSCNQTRKMLWSAFKLHRFSLNVMVSHYHQRHIDGLEAERLIALTGTTDPVFALRDLSLLCKIHYYEADTLFRFIRPCPHVERLAIPSMDAARYLPEMASVIASNMPNLQHLNLQQLTAAPGLIVQLISACNNLRSFVGSPGQARVSEVYKALLNHRETLEELNLIGGHRTSSHYIQTLLSSCPKLEVFEAMGLCFKHWKETPKQKMSDPILLAESMLRYAGPWACQNLRVLKLRFAGTEKSDEGGDDSGNHESDEDGDNEEDGVGSLEEVFPRVLYEQISQLSELEVLWLGRVERVLTTLDPIALADYISSGNEIGVADEQSTTLDEYGHRSKATLRLEALRCNVRDGLVELTKLRHLKQLELRNMKPYISWADFRATKSSWRSLDWHYN
ncbi:hypothetical protein BGZ58_001145 [Dissophora ornata]|nr:hypothetical protein BGZ58_001145 [Dissophora ornata]